MGERSRIPDEPRMKSDEQMFIDRGRLGPCVAPSRCEDFQMRVLLVEDDRKSANFWPRRFRAEGFAVDHLDNGDDALAAFQDPLRRGASRHHAQGRDGLSVLKQMRARKTGPPVLLLSARAP